MDSTTHRGVERTEDLVTVLGCGSDRHPDRAPGLLQSPAIVLVDILVLVEDAEAHHMEVHIDRPDLLHLENPPGSDPGERTGRVEPEVGAITGVGRKLSRSSTIESVV